MKRPNQHLFEALENVCNFTALESDIDEILRAVERDRIEDAEDEIPDKPTFVNRLFCPKCKSDNVAHLLSGNYFCQEIKCWNLWKGSK